MQPYTIAELETALEIVVADSKRDVAVRHPFELALILSSKETFLSELRDHLNTRNFNASGVFIVDVPKGGGLVRPRHELTISDQVTYSAVCRRFLPSIYADCNRLRCKTDYADIIRESPQDSSWFEPYFINHRMFIETSVRFANDNLFVVVSDIAAYYENVSHAFLISELRRLHLDDSDVELLRNMLRTWCPESDRGLPQGYTASDLLSKLYLAGLDEALNNHGLNFIRYKDDIRLFVTSEIDAKLALQILIQKLRLRTLNVQSSKTKILRSRDAKGLFEGFMPLVQKIANEFDVETALEREQLAESIFDYEYLSVRDILEVKRDMSNFPAEVLGRAYCEHIIAEEDVNFNKSLFRYLLNNLGRQRDKVAIHDAFSRLHIVPQETEWILRYFGSVQLSADELQRITDYLVSSECIYDFQKFQILEFLFRSRAIDAGNIVEVGRRFVSHVHPHFLRSFARALLMNYGNASDLNDLKSSYGLAANDRERAEIVCSVVRLEISRRNAWYAGLKKNTGIIAQAVTMALTDRIPGYIKPKV